MCGANWIDYVYWSSSIQSPPDIVTCSNDNVTYTANKAVVLVNNVFCNKLGSRIETAWFSSCRVPSLLGGPSFSSAAPHWWTELCCCAACRRSSWTPSTCCASRMSVRWLTSATTPASCPMDLARYAPLLSYLSKVRRLCVSLYAYLSVCLSLPVSLSMSMSMSMCAFF